MLQQAFPDITGRYTNDRIARCIVRGVSSEQRDANASLPKVSRVAVERSLNNVFEECLTSRAALKSRALEDLIQVSPEFDSVLGGFANPGGSQGKRLCPTGHEAARASS